MVVPFLFFSGYGIGYSVKMKGRKYIDAFPKQRLFTTWLSFALCLIPYIIVSISVEKEYTIVEYLLAFIGWTSIGNSNWFMFDTFLLYILFIVSFNWLKKIEIPKQFTYTFLVIISLVVLYFTKESWWWNTILVFPIGLIFSQYKDMFDIWADKNNRIYNRLICSVICVFFLFYFLQEKVHAIFYCGYSAIFCAIIIIIMKRISFNSRILSFFGKHVFSIYCLQRLTFISFEKIIVNPYFFIIVCFCSTVILSVAFDAFFKKINPMRK